jgi:hypothetical protein
MELQQGRGAIRQLPSAGGRPHARPEEDHRIGLGRLPPGDKGCRLLD